MGIMDKLKTEIQKAGANKGKFIYFREGQKIRVRFLNDMEDGIEAVFHDSFAKSVFIPCRELFGKSCEFCDDEELRTRKMYIWTVWDYEANETKLFMFPVNNCSPLPALMALYETYGTLLDRDFVISSAGKQTNKTFAVVPMDKAKFRNEKAKPYSKSAILKMIAKAYPYANGDSDEDEDTDEDEEETPPKAKKGGSSGSGAKGKDKGKEKTKAAKKSAQEPEESDYDELTPRELYKLCIERKIEAKPKKSEEYYIELLKENDKANDDWGDDEEAEDGDNWEDEEE